MPRLAPVTRTVESVIFIVVACFLSSEPYVRRLTSVSNKYGRIRLSPENLTQRRKGAKVKTQCFETQTDFQTVGTARTGLIKLQASDLSVLCVSVVNSCCLGFVFPCDFASSREIFLPALCPWTVR